MLMAVLVWGSVLLALAALGWAAYKVADRIEKDESKLRSWDEYVSWLEQSHPEDAAFLKWVRESGDSTQYGAWLGRLR